MMNERRRRRQILQVDHYDGQRIYCGRKLFYELGGYLGGGAAGVVYEAFCARTKRHVAIKILNPVGYKLLPSSLLARCIVAMPGKPLELRDGDGEDEDEETDHHDQRQCHSNDDSRRDALAYDRDGPHSQSGHFGAPTARMRIENVWWLLHPTTKQAVAAYEDPHTGMLRELSLPHCIAVWGAELLADPTIPNASSPSAFHEVQIKNQVFRLPRIPKKFVKFARTRGLIHREIANMSGLAAHENVLRLDEALEMVQDTKCTTFLVLELASGGELFDRIKLNCGTNEATARRYCQQLICGVAFCHESGVCHRDLKPENLLLADHEEPSTLKLADFGLSAIFAITETEAETDTDPENGVPEGGRTSHCGGLDGRNSEHALRSITNRNSNAVQAIRRLRSVVGSPHYVAPEVLMDAGQGYDGAKADAWSIGVIVYAMLAGNLPFGKDLLTCLRYDKFKQWCYTTKYSDDDPAADEAAVMFPSWFFPASFSLEVKSLITQLLYPDASMRLSVVDAQRHAWVLGQSLPHRPGADNSVGNANDPGGRGDGNCSGVGNGCDNGIGHGNESVIASSIESLSVEPSPKTTLWNVNSRFDTTREQQQLQSGVPSLPPSFPSQRQTQQAQPPYTVVDSSPFLQATLASAPPTPQAKPQAHLCRRGHMPSVDETIPLASLPRPLSLKTNDSHRELADKSNTQHNTRSAFVHPVTKELMSQCSIQTTPAYKPTRSSWLIMPATDAQSAQAATTPETSEKEMAQPIAIPSTRHRPFTSPPLATGARNAWLHQRHQHRRNSPPELLLGRFGTGNIKLEAIQTEFDEGENAAISGAGIYPDDESDRASKNGDARVQPSSPLSSLFRSALSIRGKERAIPPSYQDLVARSTRFLTAMPADHVLSQLEAIITATSTIDAHVTIDWGKYQLDVRSSDDKLVCAVRVFLFQRGVYLVEFCRGQVDIFQFKRFYEELRATLTAKMALPTAMTPQPARRQQLATIQASTSMLPAEEVEAVANSFNVGTMWYLDEPRRRNTSTGCEHMR